MGELLGLPIHLLLRPLEAPKGSKAPRERNILGETPEQTEQRRRLRLKVVPPSTSPYAAMPIVDWLRADDPHNQIVAFQRIRALAQVSGIAGLVIEEPVPPKCDPTLIYRYGWDGISERELGYHLEHRLACLRQGGGDPLDNRLAIDDWQAGPRLWVPLPWFYSQGEPRRELANYLGKQLSPFRRRVWDEGRQALKGRSSYALIGSITAPLKKSLLTIRLSPAGRAMHGSSLRRHC